MRQDNLTWEYDKREVIRGEAIEEIDAQSDPNFQSWLSAKFKLRRMAFCPARCLTGDSGSIDQDEKACMAECKDRYDRNLDLF